MGVAAAGDAPEKPTKPSAASEAEIAALKAEIKKLTAPKEPTAPTILVSEHQAELGRLREAARRIGKGEEARGGGRGRRVRPH